VRQISHSGVPRIMAGGGLVIDYDERWVYGIPAGEACVVEIGVGGSGP